MIEPARSPAAASLEAWVPRLIAAWRKRARRAGPDDRLSRDEVERVGKAVRHLSLGLTRARRLVGEPYMDEPDLLGAYLLYFWPVSYLQGRAVLGESGTRLRAVLDLGSGPGPFAMAALDAGASEVMLADRSERALALASELATSIGKRVATRAWNPERDTDLPGGDPGWTAITFGHVLNELWLDEPDRLDRRATLVRTALGRIRKGGSVVLVDPALRHTTRDLLAVRDRLVADGFPVRAPCLFRGPCPALLRDVDWCHADRPWDPPAVLRDVAAAAGLHKESLKMAYAVLGPAGDAWPEPPAGRLFRVVSEHLPGHDRIRAIGCGPEGRLPIALADNATNGGNQAFRDAARGEVLELDLAQPSEGGGVKLTAESTVRRIRRAGDPIAPSSGRK